MINPKLPLTHIKAGKPVVTWIFPSPHITTQNKNNLFSLQQHWDKICFEGICPSRSWADIISILVYCVAAVIRILFLTITASSSILSAVRLQWPVTSLRSESQTWAWTNERPAPANNIVLMISWRMSVNPWICNHHSSNDELILEQIQLLPWW